MFVFTPVSTEPGYEGFPAVSPDGQTVAYAADQQGVLQIFTRRLSSAGSARLTDAPYDAKHPFWSPDGRRIYYVSRLRDRDGVWAVAAAGGLPQPVIENASRAAISPQGRSIAFLRDEQRADVVGTAALWIADVPEGELNPRAIEAAKRPYAGLGDLRFTEAAFWFSPDGRRLGLCAVPLSLGVPPAERGWQFWVLPLPDGEPAPRLRSWSDVAPRVSNFSWWPDSRHIVLGAESISTPGSDLWLADLDGDRVWPLTRGPDNLAYPSVAPGGQVLFARSDGDYNIVEIAPQDGTVRQLLATASHEAEPAWSPADPGLLAYVTNRRGQDEIWLKSRDGRLDRPFVTQEVFGQDRTTLLSSPSFSPDGERIAYQRNGSRPIWPLRIWYSHLAGGPPTELLPASREGYHGAPAWSPDGQWIVYPEWKDERWSLVKVRVGTGEPTALRTDGTANAAPRWSPRNDWISWETPEGFVLVSPDGRQQRRLSPDQLLVHDWSPDGSRIVGIREDDDLRLTLISLDVGTGDTRVHADLGLSPPVNYPVRGLSVAADGRVALAIFRLHGDLWLLDGVAREGSRLRRAWPFRFP